MAKYDDLTVIQPGIPEPMVFAASGAVKVTAYGLAKGDCIHFMQVEEVGNRPKFKREGCALYEPSENEIALSSAYAVGDCIPTLYDGRPSIYINQPGKYLPVVVGEHSDGQLLVKVEPVNGRDFSAVELGISPCGCPCVDTDWTWTGKERCNRDKIEREYESNCGNIEWRVDRDTVWTDTGETRCYEHNLQRKQSSTCGEIRWVDSGEKCGYSPSVAMVMTQCGGVAQTGYAFDPNEERDPAASVALEDCDGVIHGYIYPTSGSGHTVKVADCEGNVLGFMANRSETAPAVSLLPETPELPKSVVGLEWLGNDLLARFSDGTTQYLITPLCS